MDLSTGKEDVQLASISSDQAEQLNYEGSMYLPEAAFGITHPASIASDRVEQNNTNISESPPVLDHEQSAYSVLNRAEPSNISISTSGPTLDSLALEILQAISENLELNDLGCLRLAAVAFSSIGVQFMLRTLRFKLTLDGMIRLQVVCNSPLFAKGVHKLEFDIQSFGFQSMATYWDHEALRRKHMSALKELAIKYMRWEAGSQDEERRLLGLPWSQIGQQDDVVQGARFQSRRNHPNSVQTPRDESEEESKLSLISKVISACMTKLPNLQEICIKEACLRYSWTPPTELRIDTKSHLQGRVLERSKSARKLVTGLGLCDEVESIQFSVSLTKIREVYRDMGDLLLDHILRWNPPKLKQLSLILPNDNYEPCAQSIRGNARGVRDIISDVCYSFNFSKPTLEVLVITAPCHHSSENNICLHYCQLLQLWPEMGPFDAAPMSIRRLEMGYFFITYESRISLTLRRLTRTLRELSLTRIEIGEGSLATFFTSLRYQTPHLKVLELYGVFKMFGDDQIVDMDRLVDEEDWSKFEEEDRRALCAECKDESRTIGYHTSNIIMTRSSHVVRKRVRFIGEWIQKVMR